MNNRSIYTNYSKPQHNPVHGTFHKCLTRLLASCFFTLVSLSVHSASTPIDNVIAIVDEDVILLSELQQRTQMVLRNLRDEAQKPSDEQIQQEIFNQLVLESIQLQMAYRAGARITDAELNSAIAEIARSNGLSLNQFQQALQQDGMSYTGLREQVRNDMLIKRVQQGMVNRRIQISDEEIQSFLISEAGKKLIQPEYRLAHALFAVEDIESSTQMNRAEQLVNTLYQRIQAGESFEQVIQSADRQQVKLNDLGWRKGSDLPSIFTDVAPTLEKRETAKPIQSASGYHLIMMIDKRGDNETIAQTKARHILLKSSAIRDETATMDEINAIRDRILAGEDFTTLAREFSEDIGSAVEGGDLGWTTPGQLVEAFQNIMDNTDINEVSPAFRSQFGWHILQVLDRREKDVTEDLQKNIAKNYLFQRKYDDELDAWLQKIRDEAYVDIK